MRRITLMLSLILGIALIAAACGSDDDEIQVGAPSDELPVDDEPEPDDPAGSDDPDLETPADDDALEEPASDLPLGGGPYPIADLTFSVDLGNGTMSDYRLACLGDTATFTGDAGALDATAACLALNENEVRDRLLTDAHLDRICTEIYGGPEVAEITGTLDDQPVNAAINRVNGCGIDDWDRMLTTMLPDPIG